ncbi:MAG: hypothetical protein ACXWVQ_01525 [Methyloceanibacter sp.]
MLTAGSRAGFALAVCLALTAPLAEAATEPEPGFAWMVSQYEGNVSLIYGSTETAEDFFLSCNNKKKEAEITVYQDIAGAKVGQQVTIESGVGSAKVALKGETATDEMSGYIFGVAKQFAVKPVVAMLGGSGPALVKMEKNELTLPEQGRAEELGKFAKACKLD